MKTQSRLKKFNGLPHELQGLDYTYDAEVEGGEVAYTPKGSKDEFIFRKKSSNIKELEKQDRLRSKRPEGDRISDISFDAIAKNLMLEESKQLASEGIDPFNGSKDVFATGGRRPSIGSVPTIDDYATTDNGNSLGFDFTPSSNPSLASPQRYDNASVMPNGNTTSNMNTPVNIPKKSGMTASDAGGYAAAIGRTAEALGQFGADDPYASVMPEDPAAKAPVTAAHSSIISAVPVVGQFYQAGTSLANFSDAGRDDMRAKGNDAGANAAAFAGGFSSPSKSFFDLSSDQQSGVLSPSQATGAKALNMLLPGLGDATIAEPGRRKYAERQQKQAGYDATLAERGLIPQSNEVVRNRTQEFKNGGMRKKYANGGGLIEPIGYTEEEIKAMGDADPFRVEWNSPVPPADWFTPATMNGNYDNPDIRPAKPKYKDEPNDAETPYVPIMDNYVISQEDADNAYNDHMNKNAKWNPPTNATNSKKKFDPNMLTSIAGGLGQIIPSIAYLAGDGKDYDRVKYPTYNPDLLQADLPLRENRDAFASARDAMRQQGKLDLGALSALATQEAKGRSGVRENIANVNTGIRNAAQLKNIATMIQQMGDEASNKGQYQTNKYEAMKDIGKGAALGARQYGMMSNDEIRKQLIASMTEQKFTELYG